MMGDLRTAVSFCFRGEDESMKAKKPAEEQKGENGQTSLKYYYFSVGDNYVGYIKCIKSFI